MPTGTTKFHFKAGNLNFRSDSYEWLVATGHKAMFKGVGTINGAGNYGFLISAIDADLTPVLGVRSASGSGTGTMMALSSTTTKWMLTTTPSPRPPSAAAPS